MFENHVSAVTLLVYGIKGSFPPRYAVYDTNDPINARRRIEQKHPEYMFLGQEFMFGKEEASTMSTAINKAMRIYPDLLRKYPMQ